MRIKKVSQVSGTLGSIVNTTSASSTDAYSCDYVNEKMNYEIGEKQIGYLDDNGTKVPLYRAIINFGATSTNPYKPSIAGLNIGQLLSISGAIKTGATDIIPIAIWYNNTYYMQTTVKLNTETIDIAWGGWGSLQGGYFILEYTKAS